MNLTKDFKIFAIKQEKELLSFIYNINGLNICLARSEDYKLEPSLSFTTNNFFSCSFVSYQVINHTYFLFYFKVSKRQRQKQIGMSACLRNLKIDWLPNIFNFRSLLLKKVKLSEDNQGPSFNQRSGCF